MNIGIYGISSQSGKAYLADFLNRGFATTGYARSTPNGMAVVSAIRNEKGIHLLRPQNSNREQSKFVSLGESIVTNDLAELVRFATIIVIAVPSNFHIEVAREIGYHLNGKQIPLILSPSRTFASPYIWQILGEGYPIICFSTSPYSSKSVGANSVFIKRRKRTWLASFEGEFMLSGINKIKEIFPQVTFTDIPALTSLNNIGAIFHPTAYLLNIKEITARNAAGQPFSFYMEGISAKPEIAEVVENIDQIRLQIADKLGIPTFGLKANPREDLWRKITTALRVLEEEHEDDVEMLRKVRSQFLDYINHCVISAQHWLDITYGVLRLPEETLGEAIGRTPTYQNNSVAQERYMDEDIPTGLVPLEALAEILSVKHESITAIINLYNATTGLDVRLSGRNLKIFSEALIVKYLTGK